MLLRKDAQPWDTPGVTFALVPNNLEQDNTPPEITPNIFGTLGSNDWYVSNITVSWTINDDESEVSSSNGCGMTTISADTSGTTLTCTATSSGGTSTNSVMIKRDATPPTVSITTPVSYGLYTFGTMLDFSASDAPSGLDGAAIGLLTDIDGITSNVPTSFGPSPGVYTFVVEATDIAGNTARSDSRFFVVYDSTGGFATGGGWLLPDSESTHPGGRANFGFAAKYKNGGSTGNLEFQYKDAEINLKSTSIDWLTITGVSAIFQGTGTINGEGPYTFRVTAKDNAEPGANADSFDIRIWEGTGTDTELYHKAKNVISGGNIVVHKK